MLTLMQATVFSWLPNCRTRPISKLTHLQARNSDVAKFLCQSCIVIPLMISISPLPSFLSIAQCWFRAPDPAAKYGSLCHNGHER